jgi:hypothetical protein
MVQFGKFSENKLRRWLIILEVILNVLYTNSIVIELLSQKKFQVKTQGLALESKTGVLYMNAKDCWQSPHKLNPGQTVLSYCKGNGGLTVSGFRFPPSTLPVTLICLTQRYINAAEMGCWKTDCCISGEIVLVSIYSSLLVMSRAFHLMTWNIASFLLFD